MRKYGNIVATLLSLLCTNSGLVMVANMTSIRLMGIISILFMVYIAYYSTRRYGYMFNPYLIITASLFLFGLGHSFLYVFGIQTVYFDFPIMFGYESVLISQVFMLNCLIFFHIGVSCTLGRSTQSPLVTRDKHKDITLYSSLVFLVCALPMVYYYYIGVKGSILYTYGTSLHYHYINRASYALLFFKQIGVISLIWLHTLFVSKESSVSAFLTASALCIVAMMSLLTGSRTEGLSIIVIILFIRTYYQKRSVMRVKEVLAVLLIFLLIPVFYEVRRDVTKILEVDLLHIIQQNIFIEVVSELGSSNYPLLCVMTDPSIPRFYGGTYLDSITSIAITAIPKRFRTDIFFLGPPSLAEYLQSHKQLPWGPGFSLYAEAYLNFGALGVGVFLVLGLLFSSFLRPSKFIGVQQVLVIITALFLILTAARRESSDITRGLTYFLGLPYLGLKLFLGLGLKQAEEFGTRYTMP